MPTRQAILISSPGTKTNYLYGPDKDVYNMFNYLTSPRGGGWKRDEIICLFDPSWRETKRLLDSSSFDYQLIYFAGHGSSDSNRCRFLKFKDFEIEDFQLLNAVPKQLIIADACRVYYPTISGIPPAEDVYSSFTGESASRVAFDECISSSANGKMIIHATQHGEEANEERYGRGGAFTLSLLYTTLQFRTGVDLFPVMITDLLANVRQTLYNENYIQVPEIVWEQGNLEVPFLIDTDQIIDTEQVDLPAYPRQTEKISALKIIGIFILAVAIIKGLKN